METRSLVCLLVLLQLILAQQPGIRNAARIYCRDNVTLPYAAEVDAAGVLSVSCESPACNITDQATQLGFSSLYLNTYYNGAYAAQTATYDFITEITPTEIYGGLYLVTVFRMQCPLAVAAIPPLETAGYSGVYANNPFADVQCFSGDTLVETPAGKKPIREVEIGELLLSVDDDAVSHTHFPRNLFQVQFSPVIMHLHKVENAQAEFLRIQLMNGRELKLTEFHLIYASTDCVIQTKGGLYAKDLKEGWCLLTTEKGHKIGVQRIIRITRVLERGYYAPLTATGDVIVNGVVASCHSNFAARDLQQSALRVLGFLAPALKVLMMVFGENVHWTVLGESLQFLLPS